MLATTAEFFYVRSELEAKVIIKKPAQQLIEKAFYNLGEGLTGKVAKNRESLRVNNAQKTPDGLESLARRLTTAKQLSWLFPSCVRGNYGALFEH